MAVVHPLFMLTALSFWLPFSLFVFVFTRNNLLSSSRLTGVKIKTRAFTSKLILTKAEVNLVLTFHFIILSTTKFIDSVAVDRLIILSAYLSIVLIFILTNSVLKKQSMFLPVLGLFLTSASTLLLICADLVSYFLILEIFSTLYMYTFLGESQQTVPLLKLKNSILLYLFGSFLTTTLFFIGLTTIAQAVGSLTFSELWIVREEIPVVSSYLILGSLLFKIGGPGTFFFKLEIYKLFNAESIIIFSIFTFGFNTLLLYFILTNFVYGVLTSKLLTLVILLGTNIPVVMAGYKGYTFGFFLGYSAIITWTFVLICFLVLLGVTAQYKYSTDELAGYRFETAKSVCYKPNLQFLKMQKNLTRSLANRICRGSKFLKSYLMFRKWYINHQRASYCLKSLPNGEFYMFKNLKAQAFLDTYAEFNSLKNLDNALLWRGRTIESIFNIKVNFTKKRKKKYFNEIVYYLHPEQRINFPWKWLARSIQVFYSKEVPPILSITPPLENFLGAEKEGHLILGFKQKAYRLFAIRSN